MNLLEVVLALSVSSQIILAAKFYVFKKAVTKHLGDVIVVLNSVCKDLEKGE